MCVLAGTKIAALGFKLESATAVLTIFGESLVNG